MGKAKNEFDLSNFELQPDGSYKKKQPKANVIKKRNANELINEEAKNKTFCQEYKDSIRFIWSNSHVSLNEWYSSKHWTHRNKVKKEWHNFFKKFICDPSPYYEAYRVELEYNSRLDPSNTITMIKLAEDTLQEIGVIDNDNKDCCKEILIKPNLNLKNFTYKLTIIKCEK